MTTIMFSHLAFLPLLLLSCHGQYRVDIDLSKPINIVEDTFLSTTLDMYLLQDRPKWDTFDFKSDRVKTLLKGLAPGYLRLGGTPADWTVFTPGPQELYSQFNELPPMLTIAEEDLDNLAQLARSCGVQLLWDLNLQLRYGYDWDPTNAVATMEYAISKGYRDVFNFELGNEPDLFGRRAIQFGHMVLNGTQIGWDFQRLYKLMKYYNFTGILVGPDTGGVPREMLTDFIKETGSFLTAVTFHHYYFAGPSATYKNYIDAKNFKELEGLLKEANSIVQATQYPNLPVWIGETSDAYNSGTMGVSDRYVSGFLWLDKLGLSAAHGIKVVMRQDFYAHNYALLGFDLYPNPDYWLSLLHKRLIGRKVFNVTLTQPSDSADEVRMYSHCTKPSSVYKAGAVTVFGLSVRTDKAVNLSLPTELQKLCVDIYLLQPKGTEGLLSRTVTLNGIELKMVNDLTLPTLLPQHQPAGQPLTLPPLAMAYFVFPAADLPVCKQAN